MELSDEIRAYLKIVASHVGQRKAAVLLRKSLAEIERLRAEIEAMAVSRGACNCAMCQAIRAGTWRGSYAATKSLHGYEWDDEEDVEEVYRDDLEW